MLLLSADKSLDAYLKFMCTTVCAPNQQNERKALINFS